MKHADSYRTDAKETEQNMKLHELSSRIRIDRKMDAQRIEVRGSWQTAVWCSPSTTTSCDRDKDGKANWIKCLIGIQEVVDGQPTGKVLAREFHGNYSCLIEAY